MICKGSLTVHSLASPQELPCEAEGAWQGIGMLTAPIIDEDPLPCSQPKWWNMSLSLPLAAAQALSPSASSNGALPCCGQQGWLLTQTVSANRVLIKCSCCQPSFDCCTELENLSSSLEEVTGNR